MHLTIKRTASSFVWLILGLGWATAAGSTTPKLL